MSKRTDLTAEAMQGFRGEPNPYLSTSASWFAFRLGEYFQRTGRPAPHDVRMGRDGWYLTIGNRSERMPSLEAAECDLYEFAVSEGYIEGVQS